MRCNGFCLSLDAEHSRKATGHVNFIDRASKGPPRVLKVGQGEALALPLDSEDCPPIVHGWTWSKTKGQEGTTLTWTGESITCTRDQVGTRPLYVGRSGRWVASDHRFFPDEERTLVPPGSTYYPLTGKTVTEENGSVFGGTFDEAADELAATIKVAVRERVEGKRVAVAFSGGLDSSILAMCAKKSSKVVAAVTASTEDSRDRREAPKAAEIMGVELLQVNMNWKTVRDEIAAIDLPFEEVPMDRSLWCLFSVASRAAAEAGAETILLGQLADELFGGYMKYLRTLNAQGEQACARLMEEDTRGCGTRGFLRDEAACSRWLEPRFPFSDGRVVRLGRSIPVRFKIKDGMRKAVLREAARRLDLPEELCGVPKKAAQYSSGIQKISP